MERLQKYSRKIGFDVSFAYDAQVYIGGSIFIEFQNDLQYGGYFKNLYSTRIRPEIPYFILGANFGPYVTESFIEKHRDYFRYQVTDLCLRDQESYKLFQDLENVRYAPDILCTYQLPVCSKKNLVLISCIYNQSREEIQAFDNDTYAKKMAELCSYYLNLGKEVCLLSMCSRQQDFEMCQKIQSCVNGQVSIAEYNGDLKYISELFASAEYVIACRFHAMILGWLANTPVFPVFYSNKTQNVIRDFGFSGAYTSIGDFASLSCEQIDANRKNNLIFDIDAMKQAAEKQFLKLDE